MRDQVAMQTRVQPLDQAGTDDNVRPKPGDIQFRGENWDGHTCLFSWPFSSLLSSERTRNATSSGVMLSKSPTFEGYTLSACLYPNAGLTRP